MNWIRKRVMGGIGSRFTALMVVVVAATAAAVGTFDVMAASRESVQRLEAHGVEIAQVAARNAPYALLTRSTSEIDAILNGLTSASDVEYAILRDESSSVVAQRAPGKLAPRDPDGRIRVDVGTSSVRRWDTDAGEELDIWVPVWSEDDPMGLGLGSDGPQHLGFIQIGLTDARATERALRFAMSSAAAGFLLTVLACAVTAVLTRRMTRPLASLAEAAERIAAGDLDQSVGFDGHDEVAMLAHRFDDMAAKLRIAQEEVLGHRRMLEGSVRERTLQLEKRTQEAERLAREAEEANRAKSQFLANMSHEIRTPLNGVFGMSEILLDGRLGDEERKIAETIYSSGEVLLHVINDVLDFSKIEAGAMTLDSAPFDLYEVLETLTQLMAARADSKGLELTCLIHPGCPQHFIGDSGRLRQVVLNLLGNAIKFTEVGEVAVSAGLAPGSEAVAEGEPVELEVKIRDTGMGIPPELNATIFDPFAQADGSMTRKYGGTGLGLAISSQLVELMGGSISFESVEGEGTTFKIVVPLVQEAGPSVEDRTEASLAGCRVLIVDDNATNREVLHHQLASLGLESESAADGLAAISLLRSPQSTFDLAILDMMMPGMTGIDLARLVRADPTIKSLPLVLLTSVSLEQLPEDPAALDIEVHLTKPVRRDDLRRSLMQALGIEQASSLPTGRQVSKISSMRSVARRILLVEDHPVNLRVASTMLRRMGHELETARDGLEALERLESGVYDLVFMDCQMPRMDGYTATREYRRRERAQGVERRTPIVALTAHALGEERQRCLDCGMDDHVSKPVSAAGLAEAIERVTSGQPSVAAPEAGPVREGDETAPLLDGEVLRALAEFDEGEEEHLLVTLVDEFDEFATVAAKDALDGAAAGDPDALRSGCHALKSSATQLGASRLAEFSKATESAIKAGDELDWVAAAHAFDAEIVSAVEALRHWVAENLAAGDVDG